MKLSKSNIKLILFIVAVAIVGLTYLYVFKDNMSDAESIQSEVDTLQTRYDELCEKQKDRGEQPDNAGNDQTAPNQPVNRL